MSNLIITIMSIALAAIVAIAGVLYVANVMPSSQGNIWANEMLNQNQQIWAAFNIYSSNNGGANFSTVNFSGLVNQGYLSAWPELIMFAPHSNNGSFTTGQYDNSVSAPCLTVNGYTMKFVRAGVVLNNQNALYFAFLLNDPYNGTCSAANAGNGYGFENAKYSNHPTVLLAKAVNKITGAVPASATIAASGLPYLPTGSTFPGMNGNGFSWGIFASSTGSIIPNYCYLGASSGGTSVTTIQCTFMQ